MSDTQNIISRLKAALPTRWFADSSPVLDGLLSGLGWGWRWLLELLGFVREQTRISTASGTWLDIIAQDFFGLRLSRRADESDDAFRHRIQLELLRERGTRSSIVAVLRNVTGRTPAIFEPARTTDTGGYGSLGGAGGGLAYGSAGGWGSLDLPFQCFVTAYRPHGSGIAAVAGWGSLAGGYGQGAIEYGNLNMVTGPVTDADIFAAIASVLPVNAIAWTQISN